MPPTFHPNTRIPYPASNLLHPHARIPYPASRIPYPASRILFTLTLLLISLLFSLTSAATTPRPNIIYILADDLGYGDISAFNPNSKIETPHLDTLARQGMRFTDAHTPSSVCTPTRYGILTGQYCWRTDLKQGVTWSYGRNFLDPNQNTVAKLLRQHGYHTAVIGKWHLGLDWALKPGPEHQLDQADVSWRGSVVRNMDLKHIDFSKPVTGGPGNYGFGYSFILPASLDIPPYCYLENHTLIEPPTDWTDGNDLDKGFMEAFWRAGPMAPGFDFTDVLPNFTRRAVDYIREHANSDQPFFLYLPLAAPHTPWVPSPDFAGTSSAGTYGDFVEMMDHEIGTVLKTIEETGITRNTLVIFTSDNGPYWVPALTAKYNHRGAAHFRGMKGDIWEGGHRVPFIASWPGTIPSHSNAPALTSLTHLIATIADILGLDQPNQYGEDSYSILPVLLGQAREVPDQPGIMMHSSSAAHFAWRQGDWKYIEKPGSGGFSTPVTFDVRFGEPTGQLYNLRVDPAETDNRFFHHPEKVKAMQKTLNAVRGHNLN